MEKVWDAVLMSEVCFSPVPQIILALPEHNAWCALFPQDLTTFSVTGHMRTQTRQLRRYQMAYKLGRCS